MDQIKIDLPFHVSPKEARLLLCFKLHEADRISLGKATELAGCSKRTFMELLAKQGTPVINYTPEELNREIEV